MIASWLYPSVQAQDARIMRVAQAVLDYLRDSDGPVPVGVLLREVAAKAGVLEPDVSTALSRLGDRLVWDYSQGPPRFSLAAGVEARES